MPYAVAVVVAKKPNYFLKDARRGSDVKCKAVAGTPPKCLNKPRR